MLLKVFAGEPLWTPEGYHLLDVKGFAAIASEPTEIDIADDRFEAVNAIVRDNRTLQGLDPDTGLPVVKEEQANGE